MFLIHSVTGNVQLGGTLVVVPPQGLGSVVVRQTCSVGRNLGIVTLVSLISTRFISHLSHQVMTYDSRSGEFDDVTSSDRCVDATPSYTATQLTVTFTVRRTPDCQGGAKKGAPPTTVEPAPFGIRI